MAKESAAAKKKREAAEAAAKAAPARNLLAEAVNALNTNTPMMATEAEMDGLLKDTRGPLVEFNNNMRSGDKIAFRATALGVQVNSGQAPAPVAAWGAPGPAPAAPAPTPPATPAAASANTGAKSYTFDAGIPVPAPRRGGRGSTVYGFETMETGQSFFIPTTADNANPAKRIASTVSSASARLDPKKFIVRSVDETAQGRGKGARVWRTA